MNAIITTNSKDFVYLFSIHKTSLFNTFNMASSIITDDKSLGPVFFWREYEEPYGFLSQWYESTFEVDGVTYQSAEMWMMIQKALLFGDEVCYI